MAKMNAVKKSTARTIKVDTKTTTNHEGAVVHDLSSLEVLFSKVLGSLFGESTFYEKRTPEEDYLELAKTILKVPYSDREYVLKIARLGREYNMIQYPLAVLTACFNDERFKGSEFTDASSTNKLQYYSDLIVRRGMDIVDIMSLQINAHGFDRVLDRGGYHRDLPLPKQLRKALKSKLESFNDYQLSKALAESREVSLADCIKLLRPCERKARVSRGFYVKVIEGKVKFGGNVKQVQSELAKVNNKNSKTVKEDVKKSLDTSTLMAIVKNLVALYRAGVLDDPKSVESIVAKLTDEKQVKSSRLLPFRFYSAMKEVGSLPKSRGSKEVYDALIKALDLSVSNMPKIKGYSAILIDRSGSMRRQISEKSKVTADEISLVLGAICLKQSVGEVFLFADKCQHVEVSSTSTIMDIVKTLSKCYVGGGTYLSTALRTVENSSREVSGYDNLILLTDSDCYTKNQNGTFSIRGTTQCYPRVETVDGILNSMISRGVIKKFYLNNLLGNTFTVANTEDYRKNLITGFSENIVDTINIYDSLGSGSSDIRKVIDSMLRSLQKK